MKHARAHLPLSPPPDRKLERFLSERETIALAGFGSRSSFRKEVAAGRFPLPVRISPGRIAWVESEVVAWQASKIAERNEGREGAIMVNRTDPALDGAAR